jgi:hypothetical protein
MGIVLFGEVKVEVDPDRGRMEIVDLNEIWPTETEEVMRWGRCT